MPDGIADVNYNGEAKHLNLSKFTPCSEIFIPVMLWSKSRITDLSNRYFDLDREYRSRAESLLLESMSKLSQPCLNLQLAFFARQERTLNGHAKEKSSDLYRRFVYDCLQGGLQVFISDYPVLARLNATLVIQWIEIMKNIRDSQPDGASLPIIETSPDYFRLIPLAEQTKFMRDSRELRIFSKAEAEFLQRVFNGDIGLFKEVLNGAACVSCD